MKLRCLAVLGTVCALALMAGCPGSEFGLGTSYAAIQDGMYAGSADGWVEIWHWDELYLSESGGSESAGTFVNGAVVKDSGQDLQIGDVEDVNYGAFTVTREVTDVQIAEGFYQVSYEVYADWDSVPMYGTQLITFTGNGNGSVAMIDTLELYSLVDVDGGAWSLFAETTGALPLVQPSGVPPQDILDLKSGKPIVGAATH